MPCCKNCLKELTSQHDQSPGVVCCEEKIALILMNPDQWKDGDFSSSAFSKTKLQKGELSVCRVSYTSVKEVRDFIIAPQLEKIN